MGLQIQVQEKSQCQRPHTGPIPRHRRDKRERETDDEEEELKAKNPHSLHDSDQYYNDTDESITPSRAIIILSASNRQTIFWQTIKHVHY